MTLKLAIAMLFLATIKAMVVYRFGIILRDYKAFLISLKPHISFLNNYNPEESDEKDNIEWLGGLICLYAVVEFLVTIVGFFSMGNNVKINL